MFWIVVGIGLLVWVVVSVVNAILKTQVDIENSRAERDYYNSLSPDDQALYRQQKALAAQTESQVAQERLRHLQLKLLFDAISARTTWSNLVRTNKEISETPSVIEYAGKLGIIIEGPETIAEIKTTREFLEYRNLMVKLGNWIDAGYGNTKIRRKFYAIGLRYSDEDVDLMRTEFFSHKNISAVSNTDENDWTLP